ncbi:hypothetical protein [Halomicrobium salinisoli]|uniref:hypothetical protein n=1 Tax=Halomicrobium salinisoli TaxID=2878391 RepID=UPI001CF02C2B|nr:hypothetical protein [Halomicrobium salinisoli]
MAECDDCGASVPRVWRHREYSEPMTHRELAWLCESCHPEVRERARPAAGDDDAVAMTDGGRR